MMTTTMAAGRLTRDPKFHPYGQGGVLANFTIAVETGKDKTQFYDCVAFNKTAELMQQFLSDGKGRLIGVQGTFQNNNRKDEQGNVTNYGMNLVVDRFHFLDSPKSQQGQTSAPQQNYQANNSTQKTYGQRPQSQAPASNYQAPPQQTAPTGQSPFQQNPASSGFGGFGGFDDDLPF